MRTLLTLFLIVVSLHSATVPPPLVSSKKAAGGSYDSDAADFFSRASISDTTQKNAVNQLVLDMKSAGVWTKIRAIYPFVGGSSSSHSHNLKSSSYQITWNGTITHNANGVTSNGGVGSYGDTGLNLNTMTVNSLSVGAYSRTQGQDDGWDVSAEHDNTNFDRGVRKRDSTDLATFADGNYAQTITVAETDGRGFFVVSRTASNSLKGYKNGSEVGSRTDAQFSYGSVNFTLFANKYIIENVSDPQYWNGDNLAFVFIGDGLTGGEVTSLNTAVEACQDSLSRGVQ